MTPLEVLSRSRALWNRTHLELGSDEVLGQLLDRGTMEDWRALHALARTDPALRRRIVGLVARVPMYLPHFWLAAMAAEGEVVQWDAVAKNDGMLA